jgi:hypothetical protein
MRVQPIGREVVWNREFGVLQLELDGVVTAQSPRRHYPQKVWALNPHIS